MGRTESSGESVDFEALIRSIEVDVDAAGPDDERIDWNAEALRNFRRVVALFRARRARRRQERERRRDAGKQSRQLECEWRRQMRSEQAASPRKSAGMRWLFAGSIAAGALGVGVLAVALVMMSTGWAPLGRESGPSQAAAPVVPSPSAADGEDRADAASTETDSVGENTADASSQGWQIDPAWVAEVSAQTGIPGRALEAYAGAAHRIGQEQPTCRLGWNTLAGIGFVESEHGTIDGGAIVRNGIASPPIRGIPLDGTTTDRIADTDGGALDGDEVWDRAVGPMQFIPSTWADWGADANGDGIRDPQNIDDAAYSAAHYLCAVGGDLSQPDRWIAAVAAYNDTIEYNHRVADAADHYALLAG